MTGISLIFLVPDLPELKEIDVFELSELESPVYGHRQTLNVSYPSLG